MAEQTGAQTQKKSIFPVSIQEIDLGDREDIERRKEAIRERNGQLVFICDEHHSESDIFTREYFAAIVYYNPDMALRYKIRRVRVDSGIDAETSKLWYNDLQGLIEVRNFTNQQI